MLRSAVIGLGNIAPVHLQAINAYAKAELICGCDVEPCKQSVLPAGIPFYTSCEEMFEKEKPDVVHLCLPHNLHLPVAKQALRHGCAVLTEKPVAESFAAALEFEKLQQSSDVPLCVCLQNRYNKTSQELGNILAEGRYGAVKGIRAIVTWKRDEAYYAEKPWRGQKKLAGSGCMINQALHTMDLMLLFAQSKISTVRALAGGIQSFELEVENTVAANIGFANGASGLFIASNSNVEDTMPEIDVFCENARLFIRERTLYVEKQGEISKVTSDDVASAAGKACYGAGHAGLIARFYDSLLGKAVEYPRPSDCIEQMRLIEAILESGETGKAIILS